LMPCLDPDVMDITFSSFGKAKSKHLDLLGK